MYVLACRVSYCVKLLKRCMESRCTTQPSSPTIKVCGDIQRCYILAVLPNSPIVYPNIITIMLKFNQLLMGTLFFVVTTALPTLEPRDGNAECLTSLSAYSSAKYAFEQQYTVKIVTTSAYNYQKLDSEPSVTTLCDGRPRVLSILTRTTETYDPPLTETTYSYYTEPTQTCTVAASACTSDCEAYTPCTAGIPNYCFVYGDRNVKVYYWPITTTSGDFCSQDGATVFAEPTSPPDPNIAVADSHTFTSSTNYISMADAYGVLHGTRRQRTMCGTRGYVDIVVPITADSFSSVRWGSDDGYIFNFADLNTVPAEVFDGRRRCCIECAFATIQDDYTPMLPLSTEIRNLDQVWIDAGCRGTSENYHVTAVALDTPTSAATKSLV